MSGYWKRQLEQCKDIFTNEKVIDRICEKNTLRNNLQNKRTENVLYYFFVEKLKIRLEEFETMV